MANSFSISFILVCLGGILTGVFTAPMKHLTRWRWENIWFIYALLAQVVIPWLLIGSMVPNLLHLYSAVAVSRLLLVLALGYLWGLGSVTFGMGVHLLGAGLGFSLIMGISTLLGTVLPLFLSGPLNLKLWPFLLGLASLIAAVALSGFAGMRRDRFALAFEGRRGKFGVGLAICVASGILSSFFNIGMVVARPIQDLAAKSGAPAWASGDAVWPVLLFGGFLANATYCSYLMRKNHTFGLFFESAWKEWAGAAAMGGAWIVGVLAYGAGAWLMGPLGPILGFPVFTALMLVCAYGVGRFAGEWRGASSVTLNWMNTAVALNVVSLFLIGYSR